MNHVPQSYIVQESDVRQAAEDMKYGSDIFKTTFESREESEKSDTPVDTKFHVPVNPPETGKGLPNEITIEVSPDKMTDTPVVSIYPKGRKGENTFLCRKVEDNRRFNEKYFTQTIVEVVKLAAQNPEGRHNLIIQ